MDIRRLLHNPDDGGWYIIGETKSEVELNEFRRSLKRNAIINTHLVNCTMKHENLGIDTEHKMKVQWARCTSALCHPKGNKLDEHGLLRLCPVQVRMSTCQLTFAGIICQAYQHLSDEHESAEPLQTHVTEGMKTHIVQMLYEDSEVKPMAIYKKLVALHQHGAFYPDPMPTKIQLRNALTYLRNRKLKSLSNTSNSGPVIRARRKRRFDTFSDGSESPPLEERRAPEY
ncbi:uncharacterized protein PHALS_07913 [Plasmopara halstedii]|uniref:Uncharacterized protein n=1 Tax=Plasmopara halstedii TaxID=4781 RepID=A0A0P1B749_PLAHL|nr:uncharacterized protein PHALS_07913 [Plasmopara halstedii]CEG50188.1 hypothetical protein PHALS_07913 [Plasmopara halstedii]|eukprot:XP_024586557.1 hypothetical protein PHALS_07913 [Plasmopara halstedii]